MHKIRTLLVDDEPIARRGIRQQLQSEADVEIIGECANGQEAVAAIRAQSPDLVFLDVQMPLLSGFGVVEEVGLDHLPAVVFVTAYDEHAIRAFEVNALDYLLKPIEPRRFQKTLDRVRDQLNQSSDKQLNEKLAALLKLLEHPDEVFKAVLSRAGRYQRKRTCAHVTGRRCRLDNGPGELCADPHAFKDPPPARHDGRHGT